MSTQTTKFFLAEDLENAAATGSLEESDLSALRAVADWIETFVANPHNDLGRPGTVRCSTESWTSRRPAEQAA